MPQGEDLALSLEKPHTDMVTLTNVESDEIVRILEGVLVKKPVKPKEADFNRRVKKLIRKLKEKDNGTNKTDRNEIRTQRGNLRSEAKQEPCIVQQLRLL